MHSFNKTVRNTFITPTGKHDFVNAPIGWDNIEQSIKRSRVTDGMVLSISQNQEFINEEKDFLINEFFTQGVDGEVQQLREEKIGNDFVEIVRDYVDFSSLDWDKTKAQADFRDNNFDKKFRDNIKEKFELDRLTDLNENEIDPLEKYTYKHKKRKVLLRSKLELETPYTKTGSVASFFFTPKMSVKYRSDENVTPVLIPFSNAINPPIGVSVGNMFYYDNDRTRQLELEYAVDLTVTAYDELSIYLVKFTNGVDLDYDSEQILYTDTSGAGGNIQLTGTATVTVNESDSLMFTVYYNDDDFIDYTFTINSSSLDITENSLYTPTNIGDLDVDCITIKQAFERWFEILDSTVTFKSDFIDNNWSNLVLFSGKTLRHVKELDAETETEIIPTIATVSFQYLFDTLFTIEPCAYGIEIEKGKVVFRIENIEYFYDSEEAIQLGSLTEIERSINKDLTYGSIVIGNKKSGENEEVYGLFATHTVNEFTLPAFKTDTKYEATTDARFDPNEIEMCFRKQYADYPDQDTKYDQDHFFVDCFEAGIGGRFRIPYNWTNHFEDVDGIYDRDSAYNYRLTPLNCLLRHGFNFKQEYSKNVYSDKKVVYKSTSGNVSLRTQIIDGTLYQENDNVPLSVLGEPLQTNLTIKGKATTNYERYKQINGGLTKKNYYKTVVFINENGEEEKGFIQDLKMEDIIDVELKAKR